MTFQATVVSEQTRQLVSETLQQVTRGPEAGVMAGSSQEGALKDDSPSYLESSPASLDNTHGQTHATCCPLLLDIKFYSVVTKFQNILKHESFFFSIFMV